MMTTRTIHRIALLILCITAHNTHALDAETIQQKLIHSYETVAQFFSDHQQNQSIPNADDSDESRMLHKAVRKALNRIIGNQIFTWPSDPGFPKIFRILSLTYVSLKEHNDLDETSFQSTFGISLNDLSQKAFTPEEIEEIGNDDAVQPLFQDKQKLIELCEKWLHKNA